MIKTMIRTWRKGNVMKSFEEMVQDIVQEKLNSEVIEKVIEEKLQSAVSSACDNIFRWNGDGKKMIEDKLKEVFIPALERSDFTKYTKKLDIALSEIIRNTTLADNRNILENFKELMTEPECKSIKLSKIFEEYKKYVAANVDTYGLEAQCDDGEPYYECVGVSLEFEKDKDRWFKSLFEHGTVHLSCEHDEDDELSFDLRLEKWGTKNWKPLFGRSVLDFNSLARISDFEILILQLNRANVEIILDVEKDEDEVEPDKEPEWSLN